MPAHTTTIHNEFGNHSEVEQHIMRRAAAEGGAYAYVVDFGQVRITRADVPSKLPDRFAGEGRTSARASGTASPRPSASASRTVGSGRADHELE